jgi:type I restriction enzyme S subunit
LHYYIRSPDIQGRIEGMHAGSTNQVELSREEILRTLLPIPSTDEQRRIVAKLDSLFNHSKGARGELAPIPRLIDRYKRAVLAWATSGKLTADWRSCHTPMESGADFIRTNDRDRKAEHELQRRDAAGNGKRKSRRVTGASGPYVEVNGNHPKAWCLTRIRHIVECLDHLRVPINRSERANRNGPIPYYGANGPVGWIDDFLFDEDLVLVVEDETFIGRQKPFSYIIKGKTWVNNHAHVLRPLGGMTADFLNIVLSYYDFTPLTSGTTGRLKLTQEALLDAPILIPPPEEQTEIMRRVQAAFAYLERLQFEHTRAAALLNRLDQAALAKAFRGELVNSTPLEGQKAAKR